MWLFNNSKRKAYDNPNLHHTHMLLEKSLLYKIDKIANIVNKNRTQVVSSILTNAVKQFEKYGLPKENI